MSKPIVSVFYDKNTLQPQQFSLPKPIIYYLAKNVNSIETYQKLAQSCKYFYATNPIQFLPCLYFKAYEDNAWMTCTKESSKHICEKNKFNQATCSQKLWLTQSLRFYANFSTPASFVSEIIPRLYRCNVNRLIISSQLLSFDEFLFLTPEVTHFHFHYVHVRYSDGKTVQLEEMIEKLPKIEILKYKFFRDDPSVSLKTAKSLIEIPHFETLNQISFYNLPPKFNFNIFYPFIFNNQQIKFDATFREPVSEIYKKSIEAYVEEIEYQPTDDNIHVDIEPTV